MGSSAQRSTLNAEPPVSAFSARRPTHRASTTWVRRRRSTRANAPDAAAPGWTHYRLEGLRAVAAGAQAHRGVLRLAAHDRRHQEGQGARPGQGRDGVRAGRLRAQSAAHREARATRHGSSPCVVPKSSAVRHRNALECTANRSQTSSALSTRIDGQHDNVEISAYFNSLLGHRPFTAITGVRIPVGTPRFCPLAPGCRAYAVLRWRASWSSSILDRHLRGASQLDA